MFVLGKITQNVYRNNTGERAVKHKGKDVNMKTTYGKISAL